MKVEQILLKKKGKLNYILSSCYSWCGCRDTDLEKMTFSKISNIKQSWHRTATSGAKPSSDVILSSVGSTYEQNTTSYEVAEICPLSTNNSKSLHWNANK